MNVATECARVAEEGQVDPLRLVQCQALLATMVSATNPVTEGTPGSAMFGAWSNVEAYVRTYAPADQYAPPPEALQQRLLVEKANAAEYSGDRATADELRIQAIMTGPRMDPRSVLDAATALSKRGASSDIVQFGNDALKPFAGQPSKKHVVFAIDLSYDPLKRPAVEAMLSIFTDSCGPDDMVGLSDLAPSWIFELTKKAGNEPELIRKIESGAISSA